MSEPFSAKILAGATRYSTIRFILGPTGWELVGPTFLLQVGPVKVTRKNAAPPAFTRSGAWGEPFDRHGLPFVRGYLRASKPKSDSTEQASN